MAVRARTGRVRGSGIPGLFVILALVVSACGGGAASPSQATGGASSASQATGASASAGAPSAEAAALRFAWWGGDTRHALTNAVVDMFQAGNPGVTISREPTDFTSYWDKLAVQAAGNDVPDILNMHVNNLVLYARNGVLAPLDPFIKSGVLDVSGLPAGFLAAGQVDGVQYMIPMGSPYMGTIFNADAVAAAGLTVPSSDYTWDDFFQFLRDWAKTTGGKAPWPALNIADSEQHFYSWLLGQGIQVFTPDGKIGFTESDLARWYTLWAEMQSLGATPPMDVQVEESSTTPDDGMLAKGRVLMEPRPSNQLATFTKILKAKMDVIGLPAGPKGPGNVMLPAGLSLSSKSPHQDIAAKFISYWENDVQAGQTYKADQGVPGVAAQRDAMIASGQLPDSQKRVFELFGQLKFAAMSPLPANAQAFITAFEAGYDPVGFGASPADGAKQLIAKLPAAMKP